VGSSAARSCASCARLSHRKSTRASPRAAHYHAITLFLRALSGASRKASTGIICGFSVCAQQIGDGGDQRTRSAWRMAASAENRVAVLSISGASVASRWRHGINQVGDGSRRQQRRASGVSVKLCQKAAAAAWTWRLGSVTGGEKHLPYGATTTLSWCGNVAQWRGRDVPVDGANVLARMVARQRLENYQYGVEHVRGSVVMAKSHHNKLGQTYHRHAPRGGMAVSAITPPSYLTLCIEYV